MDLTYGDKSVLKLSLEPMIRGSITGQTVIPDTSLLHWIAACAGCST